MRVCLESRDILNYIDLNDQEILDYISENQEYEEIIFKKYEPIGCRDEYSCNYFRKHGIESYIMGCYTLCLPERDEITSGKV